jgi:hypothetical protein
MRRVRERVGVRVVGLVFGCALSAVGVAAQRPIPGAAAEAKVSVTIALQIGSDAYKVTGQGTCHHAAQASIYDVPAEQWSVQQSDGSRSLALTMWRLKNPAGDMLSLSVTTGAKSHNVNTVKAGRSGPTSGTGTVTLAAAAQGGTFTIDATTADGTRITGTIMCGAFTAPRPVAGD